MQAPGCTLVCLGVFASLQRSDPDSTAVSIESLKNAQWDLAECMISGLLSVIMM